MFVSTVRFGFIFISILYWLTFSMRIEANPETSHGLGDRLIAEINGKSFSQRQVELFFLVRESLQESPNTERALINKVQWSEALEFFVGEMILAMEADRVGSGVFSQEQFERLKTRSKVQMASHKGMAERGQMLGMSKNQLESIILTILKVETLRSFKKQTATSKSREDTQVELRQPADSWISDIYSRSSVRYYTGAKDFQYMGKK